MLPDGRSPLDHATAHAAFADMLDGKVADAEVATFLTTMAERDETSIEIAAATLALRERMIPVKAPPNAIDVCGTGGDGAHSLNVSTAVAIVVAACGVPVAKHGNRAASSKAGAADTLEALGLDLARASARAEESLADLGIAFLFAQAHHPALGRLAPVRRAIGRRTIFNLIGPIANPARVTRQLVGVARPDYLGTYAEGLRLLGTESGDDGLGRRTARRALDLPARAASSASARAATAASASSPRMPASPRHPLDALRGGDPAFNAAALRAPAARRTRRLPRRRPAQRRRRADRRGRSGRLARGRRGSRRGDRQGAGQRAARLLDRVLRQF